MRIKRHFDFSLSKSGVKSQISTDVCWGAYFKLDDDVRDLFPFINAEIKDAKYQNMPEHIQFEIYGARCTLYPVEVIAAAFEDKAHALDFAQSLIAFLNDLDKKKTLIIPEFKPYKAVSPIDIYKLLPKTNCGKCGYLTCIAFSAALGRGLTTPDLCPGFTKPLYTQAVYPVYGKQGKICGTFSIETAPNSSFNPGENAKNIQQRSELSDQSFKTNLTGREIQVLRLAAQGATNIEISKELEISSHTVKSHIIHIFNKLGVNDRTQAAVWAAHQNIL